MAHWPSYTGLPSPVTRHSRQLQVFIFILCLR